MTAEVAFTFLLGRCNRTSVSRSWKFSTYIFDTLFSKTGLSTLLFSQTQYRHGIILSRKARDEYMMDEERETVYFSWAVALQTLKWAAHSVGSEISHLKRSGAIVQDADHSAFFKLVRRLPEYLRQRRHPFSKRMCPYLQGESPRLNGVAPPSN